MKKMQNMQKKRFTSHLSNMGMSQKNIPQSTLKEGERYYLLKEVSGQATIYYDRWTAEKSASEQDRKNERNSEPTKTVAGLINPQGSLGKNYRYCLYQRVLN
jgi:hypothetical protein